ncbi:cell wall metabolism sensor histidine kinase WalK [Periweissella ghanensis]|uniref:histidine kinase n=1 Tax=Periweissella ghanensis TaxID=467997 RepID=A0ABN8BQ48_9LACO|nr:cell wall metabolism sensor histidine kinase WalK [Periweissella ghanensis]MCM0601668.1 cell wall metabolism sensor histidine kinase WalK [Periweissella ghanensis]CAH0418747.1 Sensor protein kinase WalK [Periweissella ghanensis]
MQRFLKLFQSIHFKIALVFALMLLVTLEFVGAFFVHQLEQQNRKNFSSQIALPTYIVPALGQKLILNNQANADSQIHAVLTDINNQNISEVRVIDAKGTIRGTTDVNNQQIVGQKTTDNNVKNALSQQRYEKDIVEADNGQRYEIVTTPITTVQDGRSAVVGVAVVRANMESVYQSINSITKIYLYASVVAIILGIIMSIVISRAITRPIEEINQQTRLIADGDYSGQVKIYGNDELGQLAQAVNVLSERVEESTAASESERRRLDSVLAHMSDGVIATDRRGIVTIINEGALNLLGIESLEAAVGNSILDILSIRGEYSLRQLLETQEELVLDLSGAEHELILHAYISLIQRASGFISGLVIVLHDVTEQEKIDRERRVFVSNVSHELRTPLTSVRSYIDALVDGAWQDPEVAPSFLKVTQDETQRMIRMINDLLALSRMDSGTTKLELEYVNLNELLNYILNRFDMIIQKDDQPEKQYSIVREFTEKDIWVELDTDKFTQVVDNLMNNAIKYSPDGSEITVRLLQTNNYAILSVTDQGLGIPRKDIARIFDRFFRVDKARSRKQGGTGLGLAISKEVVTLLGGRIWVDSVEGKGSTFYISLPFEKYDEGDDWDAE